MRAKSGWLMSVGFAIDEPVSRPGAHPLARGPPGAAPSSRRVSLHEPDDRAHSPSTGRPDRSARARPGLGSSRFDGTWGTIQPIEFASGVRTVGELKVIAHIDQGRRSWTAVGRTAHEEVTIPSAVGVSHTGALARMGALDPSAATIFFCNGPQCFGASAAVRALLGAG